jgi:FkbM family methyltransferase
MVEGQWKIWMRSVVRKMGYQISRLEPGVDANNATTEQQRLLGDNVSIIFEVGAADGRDCLDYAQRYSNATVHAFEPMPENYAKLAQKAQENPRIIAHQMALSDKAGTADFFVAEWDDASSLLKSENTGSTFDAYHKTKQCISVSVDTIDHICSKNSIDNIDLLKIDAQGAELKILIGAHDILSRIGVRVIYCEIQFLRLYQNAARFDEIWSLLSGYGYRLHNIYNLVYNHRGEICWGDAIFVREADFPSNYPKPGAQ